jgi:SAM-dependent methyltransferase
MKLLRTPLENYKGRLCGCAPGTHAALVSLITRHVKARQGVLDIGCHAGALLCRLRDAGFADLTGADLDTTRFNLDSARFRRLELNAPFAEEFDRRFHLITCTDVIEHLDSPRNFLTQARALLEDAGHLALSFPNVAFWEGRLKFLLKGELWGFGEGNYRAQRHISPMTVDQTRMMLQEIGFDVVALASAGSFATPLRRLLTAPLWLPLRAIGGPTTLGESTIVLARKTAPVADLKAPTHYRNRWNGIPDQIGMEALQPART